MGCDGVAERQSHRSSRPLPARRQAPSRAWAVLASPGLGEELFEHWREDGCEVVGVGIYPFVIIQIILGAGLLTTLPRLALHRTLSTQPT